MGPLVRLVKRQAKGLPAMSSLISTLGGLYVWTRIELAQKFAPHVKGRENQRKWANRNLKGLPHRNGLVVHEDLVAWVRAGYGDECDDDAEGGEA